jgi:hypothetical protein
LSYHAPVANDPIISDELLIARARARGLAFDEARAAALRPLAESLLARLARFGRLLPREAAPPPLGTLAPGRAPEREP